MRNFDLKSAFTMAEAIIVMTILGIIATIMITNLKPAEFRDKGLQVAAKKLLREIDEATNQIIINNTVSGSLNEAYHPENNSIFAANTNGTWVRTYYKKYLSSTRKEISNSFHFFYGLQPSQVFSLKDGSCVGYSSLSDFVTATVFPGEKVHINTTASQGFVFFDVNCEEEPNLYAKDIFIVPLYDYGIKYD